MSMTSRERVRRCLRFEYPDRIPREMWTLPWATSHFPAEVEALYQRFPGDFGGSANVYRPSARRQGDPYAAGTTIDDWGCVFENIQAGVHGEVRRPILTDLADWRQVQPPYEMLPEDPVAARDAVNRACAASTRFIRAGCCPRPWERYQFLRGSEHAMIDLMEDEPSFRALLGAIQDFHLRELEFWVTTDVDAIMFMDDWGAQSQLLIPPAKWREIFKPLYRAYCDLAKAHGKFVFMHSDGYIREIYEDLIEIGVDALNSQLFCMDIPELGRLAKGRITFWGEIDRQHVMGAADPEVGRAAVRQVVEHLYDPAGGVIAQCEIGAGLNPAVAVAVFEEWDAVSAQG